MDGKLVIAKFQSKIIHISQYQDSQHKGEIYCPFCNPAVLLEHNMLGFFKAWRNKGGHNCKSINVNYFDADWEGKQYVNVIRNNAGNINITIDINSIAKPSNNDSLPNSAGAAEDTSANKLQFPKYKHKEKVFREVITSVYQMKRLIEKNEFASLKELNYFFKVDKNECLNFNEVVYKYTEIGNAPHNKRRFCIFDIEKIIQKDGKVYLNSFIRNSYQIVGVLEYPYPIKKLKGKLEGQFVIAFGRIIKTKSTTNKVYLELLNDFNIVKLNEDEVSYLFKDSVKLAFVPPVKINEKPVQKELANINTYYDVDNKPINIVYQPKEPIKTTEKLDPAISVQTTTKVVQTSSDSKNKLDNGFNKANITKKDSFIKKLLKRIF